MSAVRRINLARLSDSRGWVGEDPMLKAEMNMKVEPTPPTLSVCFENIPS
jgi:hypothetical protein